MIYVYIGLYNYVLIFMHRHINLYKHTILKRFLNVLLTTKKENVTKNIFISIRNKILHEQNTSIIVMIIVILKNLTLKDPESKI